MLPSLIFCAAFALRSYAALEAPKRIFFFGDSFTTSEYEPKGEQPSAEEPLGNPPFPGRTRSGGINWAGILTTELNTSFTLGYNYAFSGGIVDKNIIPGYFDDIRSFTESMDLWEATVPEIPYTSKSTLAGVLYGTNDILSEYWERDQDAPVAAIVESYIKQLQRLYDAKPGVRYFFALTEPPILRAPMIMEEPTEGQARIQTSINLFNKHLASRMAAFAEANPDAIVKLIDSDMPFNEALNHPTKYGAPNNTCQNMDGVSCLWWDGLHPGIEMHRLMAKEVFKAFDGIFF